MLVVTGTAKLIDGKAIAQDVRLEIKAEIEKLNAATGKVHVSQRLDLIARTLGSGPIGVFITKI